MTEQNLIDLHVVKLDVTPEQLQAHRKLLSPAEAARADRFTRLQHARRWTACHAALRKILAGYCNTTPEAILFSEVGNGKPVLEKSGVDVTSNEKSANGELHFNLSHSERVALIAVTDIGPIGVDVEYERDLPDWKSISARYFSRAEQAELATVKGAERLRAFYCCWTRKEAVIKATGEGLSAQLDAFDVSLRPDRDAVVHSYHGSTRNEHCWQLHHLQPHPGYIGAVAIRHSQPIRIAYPAAHAHTDITDLTAPISSNFDTPHA